MNEAKKENSRGREYFLKNFFRKIFDKRNGIPRTTLIGNTSKCICERFTLRNEKWPTERDGGLKWFITRAFSMFVKAILLKFNIKSNGVISWYIAMGNSLMHKY